MVREVCVALAALWIAGSAAAEGIGWVAAVRGMSEIRPAEGSYTLAAIDRNLAVGDEIRTGQGGWIKMLLADDTTLAVDADSEVVLEGFGTRAPSRIRVRKGRVRIRVNPGFGSLSKVEMHAASARIVSKGTEWTTWVHDRQTWVCSVRGEVLVSGENGEAVELSSGACAQTRPGHPARAEAAPTHLEHVAMRPGHVPDRTSFPASIEPDPVVDETVIDVNDRVDTRLRPGSLGDGPPASAAVP